MNRSRRKVAAAFAAIVLLLGCSKSTEKLTAPPPSGGLPPGWNFQAPAPGVASFAAVATPDAQTVVAVGAGGFLARREAGGSWQYPRSGTAEALLDVVFAGSSDGLAVGEGGTALWTTDGGGTWQARSPPTGADLGGAHLLAPGVATVVGASGTIWRTTNAGAAWNDVSADPSLSLYGVHFLHADTGWVVGGDADSAALLVTTDGGATWERRCCAGSNALNRVTFRGALGLAVGSTARLLTRDRGATWLNMAIDDVSPVDVDVADAGQITVVGFSGSSGQSYSYSDDGGLNWRKPDTPVLRHTTTSVSFATGGVGWSVGSLGTVLRTGDGGASWDWGSSLPREGLEGVHFVDAGLGWVVGAPGIFHTSDGGASWTRQRPPTGGGASLVGVWFTGASTGFAVGVGVEPLLRTTNGGRDWTVLTPTVNALRDIFFLDASRGWAVGTNEILATADGGATWDPLSDGVAAFRDYFAVHFADASHGWVAGYEGRLMRTVNGGTTWEPLLLSTTSTSWHGLFFRTATEGWMVGSDGGAAVILHTTDGGVTWGEQRRRANGRYSAVRFVGGTGWVVGYVNGIASILNSTDGGATWNEQLTAPPPFGFLLNAISLSDASVGTAVGNFGLVLRTENGGRP